MTRKFTLGEGEFEEILRPELSDALASGIPEPTGQEIEDDRHAGVQAADLSFLQEGCWSRFLQAPRRPRMS